MDPPGYPAKDGAAEPYFERFGTGVPDPGAFAPLSRAIDMVVSGGIIAEGAALNGVASAGPALTAGGATCSGIVPGPALPGTPGITLGTGAGVLAVLTTGGTCARATPTPRLTGTSKATHNAA